MPCCGGLSLPATASITLARPKIASGLNFASSRDGVIPQIMKSPAKQVSDRNLPPDIDYIKRSTWRCRPAKMNAERRVVDFAMPRAEQFAVRLLWMREGQFVPESILFSIR